MKYNFLFISIILGLLSVSCNNDNPSTETIKPAEPVKMTELGSRAAEDVTGFYVDFFKTVCSEEGNKVCSPLSATFTLAMFANGVEDNVKKEIEEAMGVSAEALNDMGDAVLDQFPVLDSSAKLAIANAWFYDSAHRPNMAYSETLRFNYNANIFPVDATMPGNEFQNLVSKWASDNTYNLIKDIELELPCNFVLANATYFKGVWEKKFDKANTKERDFKGATKTSTVPMMSLNKSLDYFGDNTLQAVKLHFGNSAFSATFVLPREGGIEVLLASDDLNSYKNWQFKKTAVDLGLPRFKLETQGAESLMKALEEMGIKSLGGTINLKAFEELTPLKNIGFKQACTISFDEEGATAAAVTVIKGDIDDMGMPLVFDRPFLFMITEESTGAILFAGKVTDL